MLYVYCIIQLYNLIAYYALYIIVYYPITPKFIIFPMVW